MRTAYLKAGKWTLAAAVLLAGTAGCSGLGPKPSNAYVSTYAAEDANPQLAKSMNGFALDFYASLNQYPGETNPGPNRMVSPAGIGIALSMLKAGAEGETARQMDKVLKLRGMTDEELGQSQMVMRDLLRGADPSVRMEIANSLWSREGFRLYPEFAEELQDSYGAQIQALDFSSPETSETINQWASDHTAGRIKEVIKDPIPGNMVLYLMNAMYFKGDWTVPFKKGSTEDRPFTTKEGEELNVPTMRQNGSYGYLDADGFRAIRLPYGAEEKFGMILALPDEDRSLETFMQEDLPEFDRWSTELSESEGTVELPRFKLNDSLILNDSLKALGMPNAFGEAPGAELGRIGHGEDGPLFVSYVSHDTFVEVNEEGTEAAAVTVVGAVATSAPAEPPTPFELKLNRPFFFAITDRTTGLIVFMGEVGNPTER